MKIIGIIPARYGSKRLPGKPLIKIKNKSLLELTFNAVSKSKVFDLIFITTDSKKIIDLSKSIGAECIRTSKNNQNGTERCAELITKLNMQIDNHDLIVNIQCDEPFIQKNHLEKLINLFDTPTKIGTLVAPINKNEINDPSVVKVSIDKNGDAINFNRNIKKLEKKNKLYKHIGVYAYQKPTLLEIVHLKSTKREQEEKLEQLRWLQNHYQISCQFIKENLKSINTINDLKNL
ncbi:MAG: 3-deoxy-manno-octulosonate cytidylyltransferase [Flavobacteriales bacterium]|nr:3-deoxy-manno-octulosonate cytidylyltransferase [Flavobacteriales bacterium]|tara:strand:- start:5728 stop:6429 length:702 start_codon:yes stop_codon:yes gene_type:complete